MIWGREERKPEQRERQNQQIHQHLEKKRPEEKPKQQHAQEHGQQHELQHRHQGLLQQQHQQTQRHREQVPQPPRLPVTEHRRRHQRRHEKEGRSSSSTPFSLFTPSSWISKLKHSLTSSKNSSSKPQPHPIPERTQQHYLNSPNPRIKVGRHDSQPTSADHHHRRKLDKSSSAPQPTTSAAVAPPPTAGSKGHQAQSLSPAHPGRISSVSDHNYISFLPADLDDGVVILPARRSYERAPATGLYEAGERAAAVDVGRRSRGLSFDPPIVSSSHADALPLSQLRRSESAKLTRIASDLTTSTATRSSSSQPPLRTEHKGAISTSGREDLLLFSPSIPETIRPINTTTPPSTQASSISTAPAAAPRGSCKLQASDTEHVQEQRRKSFSSGGGHKLRRKNTVRVHSPRVGGSGAAAAAKRKTAAEVAEKILPLPRKTATTTTVTHPHLESFAVVKCSSDPRRDFRDSMLEMISELGMARPAQLEGLLACYLSLNNDEYHDVIVRVFREVWLDLILDTACCSSTSPRQQHQRASA